MTERGKHTFHEITSQPQIWQHALTAFNDKESELAALFENNTFDNIIVTGCGSTYYLALTAARLIQKFSYRPARAYPASEIVLYPDATLNANDNTLLIAVSRSGTTSETVRALNVFRERGMGKILTVTCNAQTPLAQGADMFIAIEAAQEQSVAQTRSFSSMCVVVQQIAAFLGKQNLTASANLPTICQTLLDMYSTLAQALGENPQIQKFFFLGADTLYGIAAEAMLKMKEMSLSYSEVFHTLEFRHGPMSMVGADSLVVGLVSASSAEYELQVLKEMQAKGTTILAIAQAATEFERTIVLPDNVPSWTVPILYLPTLQLVAYHRSLFNQQDPDNPHNLTAVISLDNI
jgi:glutamine---fructose-6-phosphate transaminase (isomerizing)